jgi:hypothetical protein
MARNLKLMVLVALPAIALGVLFFMLRGGERDRDAVSLSPGAAAPAVAERQAAPPTVREAPLRNPDTPSAAGGEAPAAPQKRAEEPVKEPPPPPPPLTPLEGAVAWLARVLPAQYANLTPAQALLLDSIDLRGATISDDELQHLRAFPRLTTLGLRGTAITDAGLPSLGGLQQLKDLDLRGTKITGSALGSLPWKLEALHLTSTAVTGKYLFVLTSMPNLKVLKLNSLAIDDAALGTLAECTALRHLELDNTGITDNGLRGLFARNPNLTRVELRSTNVSPECLRDLTASYPTCEFISDTPARPNGVAGG